MAKEGFDWIWCEHALTIGYRSSLTEIVQIIGRATRDAEGKQRARFTNLIAEPSADQSAVAEAVNDMLKAISASFTRFPNLFNNSWKSSLVPESSVTQPLTTPIRISESLVVAVT